MSNNAGMTITEFLEARIAEDEAAAQAEHEDYADTTLLPTYDSEHQAIWNTGRVLAECAAKRAILALHRRAMDVYGDALGDTCTMCADSGPDAQAYPCATVRTLAAIYADHPDYREVWTV